MFKNDGYAKWLIIGVAMVLVLYFSLWVAKLIFELAHML